MTATEQRIARWMTALFEAGGFPDDEPVTFALTHAAVDQGQRTLRSWRVDVGRQDLEKVIADIEAEAAEDAAEMGGMQRYLLHAHVKGKEVGSLALRYNIEATTLLPAIDSEPASARGLVAQAQRHTEGVMRLFIQGFGSVVEAQHKIIASHQAMIEAFHKQQAENLDLQYEFAGRKIEHELALDEQRSRQELRLLKEQANQERLNEGLKKIIYAGQQILSIATKGKVPPPDPATEEEKLARAFAEMDEKTFEAWLQANVPEEDKRPAVRAFYQRVRQQQADAEAGSAVAAEAEAPAANTKRRASEDQIFETSKALYAGLATVDVPSLVPTLLGGTSWDGLGPEQKAGIAGLAAGALAACPGTPPAEPELAGRALWQAVCANASSLPALAAPLTAGTAWPGLSGDEKKPVIRIAAQLLAALPWPPADSPSADSAGRAA